jgi:hypothetical protein
MAKRFGGEDKSSEEAAKRPAATIDGTATVVEIEPQDAAAPAEEADIAAPAEEPRNGPASPAPEPPAIEASAAEAPPPSETEEARRIEFGQPPTQKSASGFRSFATHLAAGMLGGLVGAIALALAWDALDLGGGGVAPDTSALEERLAKLEAAPAPPGDNAALAALDTRIKDLEKRPVEAPADLSGLADRVGQLETSFKTLAEAAEQGGSVPDAAALAEQIGEAERRLQGKIDTTLAEAELATSATMQALQNEIGALRAKLGALAEAELGSAGDAASLEPEVQALTERIAKLESALPDLASAIDKEAADAKSAALAIAFANLRASVAEGRTFAAELQTLQALSPKADDLGALPAHAGKGIPTLPALARDFTAAKDAALAPASPPPDASILDGLLASAQSLVKIRRVDEAATGDSPGAVLARAEALLDKGDLAGSVKEVEALDGAPRAAFADWLDQARARLGADDNVKRLEGLLLVSVGGGTAPAQDPD